MPAPRSQGCEPWRRGAPGEPPWGLGAAAAVPQPGLFWDRGREKGGEKAGSWPRQHEAAPPGRASPRSRSRGGEGVGDGEGNGDGDGDGGAPRARCGGCGGAEARAEAPEGSSFVSAS